MPFGGRGEGGGELSLGRVLDHSLPGSGYIVYCITNTSRAVEGVVLYMYTRLGRVGGGGGRRKLIMNCTTALILFILCALAMGKYMYMKLKEIYYFSVCISIICYDRSHCCYELTYIYVKNRVLYTCMYPAAVLYYAFLPSHKV